MVVGNAVKVDAVREFMVEYGDKAHNFLMTSDLSDYEFGLLNKNEQLFHDDAIFSLTDGNNDARLYAVK